MRATHDEGRVSLGLVCLILLALAGAGAWNYRRNLAAEEAERAQRPFSGYATEDLEALAEAYRAEIAHLSGRYEAARGERIAAKDRGFVGDQIDEYERVRRRSGARRAVGAELGEREAALRDVEAELRARAGALGGWQRHLRLLTTI